MAELSRASLIQRSFARGGFAAVFVDELGWDASPVPTQALDVGGGAFKAQVVAHLKGFNVYVVDSDTRPTRQIMRAADEALAQLSPERLEIFRGPDSWFWHWPRRTAAGTVTFEAVETSVATLPTFLAQRLTGLQFTASDHRRGLTLTDVRDRVHGHFDASNVTKRFYDRFKTEHAALAKAIVGVPASDRIDYATTLLNRLMFLYFMQKKEFLNGDPRYLENTLSAVQRLRGADQYYSFYRDALLPLFFDKLNSRDGSVHDPDIAAVLGDVPYVNGGIFGRSDLEERYPDELLVPDSAFENVLKFFSEFNWHLDTRPTGNPDEINPEVIGYIFEQYINSATSGKKEHGAYYTAHDVTAHMVSRSLIPRILDDVLLRVDIFSMLSESPERYIQPAMLHGWATVEGAWAEVHQGLLDAWRGDPIGWGALDDAAWDSSAQLPGESWVETFHRRDRVEALKSRLAAGEVSEVNKLITENLNGQLLLTDAIERLPDGESVNWLFWAVTDLSVFDPTCGSGAFLFAALEMLEIVYSHIVDAARALGGAPEVVGILTQVDAQPSSRYFIRKHIAIRNLFGTDLMTGAIETAKLRVFLALAACVDSAEQLQPLPDLDFNLKVGNLVVGFKDVEDVYRVAPNDLLLAPRLIALEPKIDEYAALYSAFVEAVESASPNLARQKLVLQNTEDDLRRESNEIYAEATRVPATRFDEWVADVKPFHWFCEFPTVLRRGGFDVIIGNPPYVRMSQLPGYRAVGYRTSQTPDLFAVCYERSLSLLHSRGRHAFIVMLNLSFSDDFEPLRRVIGDRGGAEWWSTFGKRPDSLFRGVQVRNTILVLGPGAGTFSSHHSVFSASDRVHLFQTLGWFPFTRVTGQQPVRGGIADRLLSAIQDEVDVPSPPGDEHLFLRPTGQYWFPVLFTHPPVLDERGNVIEEFDHGMKKIRLRSDESPLLAGAALAGKVAYAWWSATGDDFHVNPDEAELPRKLVRLAGTTPELFELALRVKKAGLSAAFVSRNNDGYVNVRWNAVRDTTDAFDRALLDAAGLLEEWRALNIWYRQCMRSSGANNNSRLLTAAEAEKFLGW